MTHAVPSVCLCCHGRRYCVARVTLGGVIASCRREFISFHGTPQAPLGWSVRWCRHWWRRRVGEAAGQPRICRRRRRLGIIRFPPATPAVRWASCLEQLCPKYVPVMPPPSSALSNVRVASYVPALWCSRPRHGLVLLPGPRGDQPRSTPLEPMQSRRRSNSPSSPPRPRPGRGGGRCPPSRCRHGSTAPRPIGHASRTIMPPGRTTRGSSGWWFHGTGRSISLRPYTARFSLGTMPAVGNGVVPRFCVVRHHTHRQMANNTKTRVHLNTALVFRWSLVFVLFPIWRWV